MIKKNFQFYKNIILVVASALTLVAVTFAWFSTSEKNDVSSIKNRVGEELIYVDFYEADESGNYVPLIGDINLDGMISGEYKQYKFLIRTNTKDPMKLNFAIEGLQSLVSQSFKEAVSIKYTLKSLIKSVDKKGVVTYSDGAVIDTSNTYIPLSELASDQISSVSLANYQNESVNYFVVYYEIGLSESAGSAVQGLSTSLGTVKLSAQLIG